MSEQYPESQYPDQQPYVQPQDVQLPQQPPAPQVPMLPVQPAPGGPQYGNYPVQQPPMYPQAYGIGYPQQVAPKNPGVALIASFFIPGLGSLINGNAGMGIAIFAAYCVAWVLCLVVIGFVLLPAVWVWGMIDAYQGAKKWNTAHGIVS
jgi:TM2 domain-containing membrane protein YozV